MTFKKLANFFHQLETTASRNQMTEILAKLLQASSVQEIDKICYLSLGRLAPLYAGVEFNLAEKMMVRVLALAYQKEETLVRREYKKVGDLGNVAETLDQREKSKPLSVLEVFKRLEEVALDSGEGSVDRKIKKLASILDDLDGQGAKYVVRIPLGKLRLGFSDKTILDALSWMVSEDKSKREEIETAYNVRADVGMVAKTIKSKGLKGLKNLKIKLGVPIMPALCQRLPTAEKMVEKVCRPKVEHLRSKGSGGQMAVEPKYDGQRVQVHSGKLIFKGGVEQKQKELFQIGAGKQTAIFSRRLGNVTEMFPDIVKALPKEVKAKDFILDGEVIGFDPKTGKLLPFQETIKRKRKYQISLLVKQVPLKLFVFDLLYLNGRGFLSVPFKKRRQALEKILSDKGKTIVLSPQILTDSPRQLKKYHDEQIKRGLEGVVVKKWQASYDPGKRGYTWVKFKQEKGKKGGGLSDTLDCLVMGYYRGRGKRAEFGIGMFLVAVKKEEKFLTVSKIGTGLTDDQWREMRKRCEKAKSPQKPNQYSVPKDLVPDVWCDSQIVVEIEADNITKSPLHTAGYALRFPRLVQFRDDKSPDQVTTLAETEKLYKLQK